MSYDLRVWEPPAGQPAPGSFEEVAAQMLALQSQPAGASTRLLAFAARLEATHPDRRQDPTGRDARLYGFGALQAQARACTSAVFAFAVPRDDALDLLRVAVLKLQGLALLDEQLGVAFLPDGRVLPPEWAERWRRMQAEAPSALAPPPRVQLRQSLGDFLAKRLLGMRAQGTSSADRRFVHHGTSHRQIVDLWVDGSHESLRCRLQVQGRDEWIETLAARTWGQPLRGATYRGVHEAPAADEQALRDWSAFVDTRWLPLLVAARSGPRPLDRQVNGNGPLWATMQAEAKGWVVALVLARLAGSPSFDELAARPLPPLSIGDTPLAERWPALVDFLRREVEPTPMPRDDAAVDSGAARVLQRLHEEGPSDPLPEDEAEAIFTTAVAEGLAQHGFTPGPTPSVHERRFEGGVQRVLLERPPSGRGWNLAFETWHDDATELWRQATGRTAPAARPTHRFTLARFPGPGGGFFVLPDQRAKAGAAFDALRTAIEHEALPQLDRARDLAALDEMLNGPPATRFESYAQSDGEMPLVVAKLAGRRKLESLSRLLAMEAVERMGLAPEGPAALAARLHEMPASAAAGSARPPLPPSRRAAVDPRDANGLMQHALRVLPARLNALAEAAGFAVGAAASPVRAFEGGRERVRLVLSGPPTGAEHPVSYGWSLKAEIAHDEVLVRWRMASGLGADHGALAEQAVHALHLPGPTAQAFDWVRSVEGTARAAEQLERFVTREALPWLHRCRDLGHLDRLLAAEAGERLPGLPRHVDVVVAWMVRGAADFEAHVAARELQLAADAWDLQALRTLAARLRDSRSMR